jgi:hypothetical protein
MKTLYLPASFAMAAPLALALAVPNTTSSGGLNPWPSRTSPSLRSLGYGTDEGSPNIVFGEPACKHLRRSLTFSICYLLPDVGIYQRCLLPVSI